MNNMKIYVVTHKKFNLDLGEIYAPLFAGAHDKENTFGYLRDDEGDNISYKNSTYSENTALYWMWKNSTEDIVGLCHYRRYFAKGLLGQKKLLNKEDILKDLDKHDLIAFKRKNGVTNRKFFNMFVSDENICESLEVMKEVHPDYYEDYKKVLKSRSQYPFCMFIAKREFLNSYCEWLFPFLEALEPRLTNEFRGIGYYAELALSVFIMHNGYKVKNRQVKFFEFSIGLNANVNSLMCLSYKDKIDINLTPIFNFINKSYFLIWVFVNLALSHSNKH